MRKEKVENGFGIVWDQAVGVVEPQIPAKPFDFSIKDYSPFEYVR